MKQMLMIGYAFVIFLIILLVLIALKKYNYWPFNYLHKEDEYSIETIISDIDYDHDGIDDYTDILNGAKGFISLKPKYKSKYYEGGYPDDDYYVCTDIIWYALNTAGYDFVKIFLDKYAQVLSNNPNEYKEFQPGDIIVYSKSHIAIVSDKRNTNKIPYILHHDGTNSYEEDNLQWGEIVGHYRFNITDENVKKKVD